MVELDAAVALLGRFPALTGVDLRIGPGETVLLQGPNGAGKTTLLRLCAGLLAPESGSVRVLGHDLSTPAGRRAVRRRVALLGHATGLYEDLTVAENVRFWARAAGLGGAPSTERVVDALQRLFADALWRAWPHTALRSNRFAFLWGGRRSDRSSSAFFFFSFFGSFLLRPTPHMG